eukprot:scaffold3899_cov106-Isochrysis_galbana.AAC.5
MSSTGSAPGASGHPPGTQPRRLGPPRPRPCTLRGASRYRRHQTRRVGAQLQARGRGQPRRIRGVAIGGVVVPFPQRSCAQAASSSPPLARCAASLICSAIRSPSARTAAGGAAARPSPNGAVARPCPGGSPSPNVTVARPSPREAVLVTISICSAIRSSSSRQTAGEAATCPSPNKAVACPSPNKAVACPSPNKAVACPSPNKAVACPSPNKAVTCPGAVVVAIRIRSAIRPASSSSKPSSRATTSAATGLTESGAVPGWCEESGCEGGWEESGWEGEGGESEGGWGDGVGVGGEDAGVAGCEGGCDGGCEQPAEVSAWRRPLPSPPPPCIPPRAISSNLSVRRRSASNIACAASACPSATAACLPAAAALWSAAPALCSHTTALSSAASALCSHTSALSSALSTLCSAASARRPAASRASAITRTPASPAVSLTPRPAAASAARSRSCPSSVIRRRSPRSRASAAARPHALHPRHSLRQGRETRPPPIGAPRRAGRGAGATPQEAPPAVNSPEGTTAVNNPEETPSAVNNPEETPPAVKVVAVNTAAVNAAAVTAAAACTGGVNAASVKMPGVKRTIACALRTGKTQPHGMAGWLQTCAQGKSCRKPHPRRTAGRRGVRQQGRQRWCGGWGGRRWWSMQPVEGNGPRGHRNVPAGKKPSPGASGPRLAAPAQRRPH